MTSCGSSKEVTMPEVNGILYHDFTDPEVIEKLELARNGYEQPHNQFATRLRLHYGDRASGIDWMITKDCTGYVSHYGRYPVLHYRRDVYGWNAKRVQDDCIVRIRIAGDATYGSDWWRHPDYQLDENLARQLLQQMGRSAFMREWGRIDTEIMTMRANLLDLKAQTER